MVCKKGDVVEWRSQAGGNTTKKTGTVVAVVPAGLHPARRVNADPAIATLTRMYDGGERDHESYIVAVKVGKTEKAWPKLYWPRVSTLKLVE